MYTLISYYTDNWAYPEYARKLKGRCRELQISYRVKHLQDTGTWISNTRLKPQFIYETLLSKNTPILWVDVDSTLVQAPPVDLSYDVGAVPKRVKTEKTFFVSTIFINNTPKGIEFAKRWAECPIEGSDHMAMEHIWREGYDGKFWMMPEEYSNHKLTPETYIQIGLSSDPDKRRYMSQRFKK